MNIPRTGWKTYTVGALTVLLGMAGGIDWSLIFSGAHGPLVVAAIGSGIVFGRALVALFAVIGRNT